MIFKAKKEDVFVREEDILHIIRLTTNTINDCFLYVFESGQRKCHRLKSKNKTYL